MAILLFHISIRPDKQNKKNQYYKTAFPYSSVSQPFIICVLPGRHYATNWQVAASIPDGVIEIFH
jgi:hypothetical protein